MFCTYFQWVSLGKSPVSQFTHSVVCDSVTLWMEHNRFPCPSPTLRACSNSCPSSWWYHPIISSSLIPFSSCLQSFPASESFPVSQFSSGGVSASASVLPMNIQDWFPLGLTVWSPHSPQGSKESFPTPQFKNINSSMLTFLYSPTLTSIYDYWKNHSFD